MMENDTLKEIFRSQDELVAQLKKEHNNARHEPKTGCRGVRPVS